MKIANGREIEYEINGEKGKAVSAVEGELKKGDKVLVQQGMVVDRLG
ncbi:MAG: hypothetical protein ABID38_06630 [Candidatus Diapherotrites archaeon]